MDAKQKHNGTTRASGSKVHMPKHEPQHDCRDAVIRQTSHILLKMSQDTLTQSHEISKAQLSSLGDTGLHITSLQAHKVDINEAAHALRRPATLTSFHSPEPNQLR
eukprot:4246511-Amphidinium_carterae.1